MRSSLCLVLLLSGSSWCDELDRISVTTERPARIYFRQTNEPGADFQLLPEPQLSVRHELTRSVGELQIKAVDDRGWLVVWTADAKVGAVDVADLKKFTPHPRWETITPATLLLFGLFFSAWKLRRERQMQQIVDDNEPLIRSDGRVPRRVLGGYRLKSVLGAGAMGVVYLAENNRGERCAVKVPLPNLISNPDFANRFERELQTATRLQHPRIVRLLALPVDRDAYIMMEFVEGKTLDSLPILSCSEELPRCQKWAGQILDALEYVHAQGIIHRDLKPANLMVQSNGDIKLMDFGIAHTSDRTRLTATGSVLGTPTFMAPEQLQGDPCDPSIDLYALGLILYERLQGSLPFSEELMEMLRQKLTGPLPSLKGKLPGLSEAWCEFLDRLGAQDPRARPTAAEAKKLLLRL